MGNVEYLENCIVRETEKHEFRESKLPEFLDCIVNKTIYSWFSRGFSICVTIFKNSLTKHQIDLYVNFCIRNKLHYKVQKNTEKELILQFEIENVIKNSYFNENCQHIRFINEHGEELRVGFNKLCDEITSGNMLVNNYCVTVPFDTYFQFGDKTTCLQILNNLEKFNFSLKNDRNTIPISVLNKESKGQKIKE